MYLLRALRVTKFGQKVKRYITLIRYLRVDIAKVLIMISTIKLTQLAKFANNHGKIDQIDFCRAAFAM